MSVPCPFHSVLRLLCVMCLHLETKQVVEPNSTTCPSLSRGPMSNLHSKPTPCLSLDVMCVYVCAYVAHVQCGCMGRPCFKRPEKPDNLMDSTQVCTCSVCTSCGMHALCVMHTWCITDMHNTHRCMYIPAPICAHTTYITYLKIPLYTSCHCHRRQLRRIHTA